MRHIPFVLNNNNQSITFFYQNICSLRNKLHLIENLTDDHDLSILCFTETWFNSVTSDLLALEGYTLASQFSRRNYEGGGVCVFVKDKINFIELEDVKKLSVEYIIELCAIELPSLSVILIVLYWPDKKREETVVKTQLQKLLNLITTKYAKKNIIIGGDLNVDFLVETTLSKSMTNLFKSFNFYQNIKEPTRVTATSATCLDIIFTNFDTNCLSFKVKEHGLSDHKGVLVSLNKSGLNLNSKQGHYIKKRKFNNHNLILFQKELQSINWGNIIRYDKSVNENYKSFHEKLTALLDVCIPKKTILIKNKLKTWLTKGIKNSCKNKRLLKILKSQTNSEVLNNYYKKYIKLLKHAVYLSKKNQYINKMKTSKNITKTMWQIIKERTNKINKNTYKNVS